MEPSSSNHSSWRTEEFDLQIVSLSNINRSDPTNGRIEPNPKRVSDLADQIAREGLLHPITVQTTPAGFQLIAGNTRYLACEQLGWNTIPAKIIPHDFPHPERLRLSENMHRNQLTPIEEALQVRSLLDSNAGDLAAAAAQIHRTKDWIQNRLQMLTWPDEISQAIHDGHITPSAAKWLARIEDPDKRIELLRYAVQNGATATTTRMWYQDSLQIPAGSTYDISTPDATPHQQFELITKVACYLCQAKTPLQETIAPRVCLPCHHDITNAKPFAATCQNPEGQ